MRLFSLTAILFRKTPAGILLRAGVCFLFWGAGSGSVSGAQDATRYDVILRRAPFGAPPPTGGTVLDALPGGKDGPGGFGNPAAVENPADLPVRMTALTRFQGVPAAGLIDMETGKTFMMRKGDRIGGYRMIDVDADTGSAVLERGTNVYFVTLSYARGQATNLNYSAHARYWTTFRPDSAQYAVAPSAAERQPEAEPGASVKTPAEEAREKEKAALEQEEAEFLKMATITDANGETRISYSLLNRLRAQAARKRAEEARALEEAREQERLRLLQAAEQLRIADEKKTKEAEEAQKKAEREALISAIVEGYEVEEQIELTAEEEARLEAEGFVIQ